MAWFPPSITTGSGWTPTPDQLAHLQEASLAIVSSLDSQEILRRVVAATRATLHSDAVVLFGLDHERAEFPLLASDGLAEDPTRLLHADAAEVAVGKAIKEQRVVGTEDLTAAPADLRRHGGFAGREGFHSVLAAPLAAHNASLGALVLYTRDRHTWSHEEASLLAWFAAQVAIALQNAELFERLTRRASDLQALVELSHVLGSFVQRDPLMQAVIERLTGWMGCVYAAVMLIERGDDAAAELKIRAHHGLSAAYVERANAPGGIALDSREPTGNGPASVAVREKRPCAVGDVFVDERFTPFRNRAVDAGYLSLVAVPIVAHGQVWGVFVLYYSYTRDFPQAELNLLTVVAEGLALALERIDLAERLVRDAIVDRSYQETDRLKTEFVSTVSHELRTPLTIIKGYTDLLMSGQAGQLDETQKRFLHGVSRNTTRLTELVNDLLDISRLESSQFELSVGLIDVGQVVMETCTEFERVAADKRVAIEFGRDKGLPPVLGDAARIAQVINNLLSNAVKFSPSGGRVAINCSKAEEGVIVSVRDEGPGIPQDAMTRLFQKFYRVDTPATRRVGGTGLGLAIAKAIVEQHGGQIRVDSKVGTGSTFAFTLPSAPSDYNKNACAGTNSLHGG